MSHLEAVCVPTQPYEIRVAVARELARLWSAILNLSDGMEVVPTCSQLVLNLLQDSDVDVRTNMAVSVAKILPGVKYKIIATFIYMVFLLVIIIFLVPLIIIVCSWCGAVR